MFLPAAGYRLGTSVGNAGSGGEYCSSTANGADGAYGVYFDSGVVLPACSRNRYFGVSVRLVRVVE